MLISNYQFFGTKIIQPIIIIKKILYCIQQIMHIVMTKLRDCVLNIGIAIE